MENGILYIVATPIGNLGDLTFRAVEVLKSVDFIAAEDTRVSMKLLNHLAITKPMISYYEHNRRQRGEEILEKLQKGESCALVTDAGTPAVSDPGEDLVALCAANGVIVVPVPGACAAICALAVSGLPTGRFAFEGFLSTGKKSRNEHLKAIANEARTLIFYEAPHKLKATLKDLYAALGDRRLSISREITKLHEECLRFTLSEAIAYFEENQPRGEFVLIVEGAQEELSEESADDQMAHALSRVAEYVQGGATLRDAVKKASSDTGVKKNILYNLALERFKEE